MLQRVRNREARFGLIKPPHTITVYNSLHGKIGGRRARAAAAASPVRYGRPRGQPAAVVHVAGAPPPGRGCPHPQRRVAGRPELLFPGAGLQQPQGGQLLLLFCFCFFLLRLLRRRARAARQKRRWRRAGGQRRSHAAADRVEVPHAAQEARRGPRGSAPIAARPRKRRSRLARDQGRRAKLFWRRPRRRRRCGRRSGGVEEWRQQQRRGLGVCNPRRRAFDQRGWW